jgi:hypothetical protein
LQLPSIFVDVDREEMEYVDGGAFSEFWWGFAVDLDTTQCSDTSDVFAVIAAGAGAGYSIIAAIASAIYVPAGIVALVVGCIQPASYGIAAARLNTASRRSGATLSMFKTGTAVVNIW